MRIIDAKMAGKISVPFMAVIVLLAISVLLVVVTQFRGFHLSLEDYYGIQVKKLELISRMQINLLRSVEAEKMAVSADTDESSQAFAGQSKQKSDAVERDRQELGLLIKKDPSGQEIELLKEFDRCWIDFRGIDRELLDFAVKNTNLKAAKLSFTQGRATLKKFEDDLEGILSTRSSLKDDLQITRLVYKALLAGVTVHDLLAPHIAAADDKQMDNIEKEIKENEAKVVKALSLLATLTPEKERPDLQKVKTDFEEFSRVTAEVIALSRQNTNVKSFELSIGRKRKITAQCDEILKSLEETVRGRSFKATR